MMNKNPLTTTVIVFAIGDGYTMWEAFATRTFPLFTALAWVQGIILIVLYLKRSRFAATFLFYSALPLYPLYFGLKLTGLTAPPVTTLVYWVAAAIYLVALPLLWKLKRDYERYIAARSAAPTL